MNCLQVQTKMVDYLSRDLRPEEIELVESHVKECAACRTDLTQLQQADSLLRRTRAEATSPGSLDLFDIVNRTTQRLEKSRRRWRRISAMALAATVLLVLFNSLSMHVEVHRSHLVLDWGETTHSTPPLEARNDTQFVAQFSDHQIRLDDLDELILVLIQKETTDEQQHTRERLSLAKRLYSMQEKNDTRWRTLTSALRKLREGPTKSTAVQYTSFVGEEK